jgi:hypothetical protein
MAFRALMNLAETEIKFLNELYFWTLSIVWCLKKLRNKICIPTKKSQYTRPKFTQGSITNHRATYLGAHTA